MQMPLNLAATIRWAIVDGKIAWDIARRIEESLALCEAHVELFDTPGLQGPVKHAELVVKLGYWLAMGQLTDKEFRIWVDCIPPDDNAGWDVDLLHCPNGSQTRRVLKMGPLASRPEACLVQETPWDTVLS